MRTLLLALLVLALPVEAKQERSMSAKRDFVRSHSCPYAKGNCIVDHVIPLCAGGPDKPGNMQWQTKAAALVKDREERRECRR